MTVGDLKRELEKFSDDQVVMMGNDHRNLSQLGFVELDRWFIGTQTNWVALLPVGASLEPRYPAPPDTSSERGEG